MIQGSPGRSPETYARSRAFPPEAERQIGESLGALLPASARVVDLGAGTGRISHLLLARDFEVWAIDHSQAMLGYLRDQRPSSHAKLRMARADVARVPLTAGCADACVFVHVLHLVADGDLALAEATRLLAPDGQVLLGRTDHDPEDHAHRVHERWKSILHARGFPPSRRDDWLEHADAWLRARHAACTTVTAASWCRERSPRDQLNRIAARLHPYFAPLPDSAFPAAFEELETWASREFASLDQMRVNEVRFIWQVYGARLPQAASSAELEA